MTAVLLRQTPLPDPFRAGIAGGWKVIDVLAEGSISRVAAQRSEMRSVLADGGGTGLVVSLRQKTAELSGGILQ